jgi:cytochrome o ubiquinol oxidase subunit III
MKDAHASHNVKHPDPHHDLYSRTVFGFWLFLLSDFVLFGTLIACYVVLGNNTYGGPSSLELFNHDFALMQTFLMLFSAAFAGFGGAAAHRKDRKMTLLFFSLTFLFSLVFMAFEYADFLRLINSGNSWQRSAFLSAFFTLLGTHGLHVLLGLIFIPFMLIPVFKEGVGHDEVRRLTCLRMFFQFLNIVWIFVYTIVYFINRGHV